MSENSNIEWTDHTFNPWEGCQKVGPGCDHCYAETRNARFAGGTAINWGPGAPRRRTSAANWNKPRQWNAAHGKFFAEHGHRQRVFCASLADVFDNAVDPEWRAELFELIEQTPNLDWLLLTKRIGNVHDMIRDARRLPGCEWYGQHNVWIGATVVNQEEADRDIPKLLQVPAAKRFLSMEPLLGPVDLTRLHNAGPLHASSAFINCLRGGTWGTVPNTGERSRITHNPLDCIDWVIVGGESGPGARPMHPEWVRSLRDQCAAERVPFLFKQWGEWAPKHVMPKDTMLPMRKYGWINIKGGEMEPGHVRVFKDESAHHELLGRIGKKAAGRQLDGVQHDGYPEAAA